MEQWQDILQKEGTVYTYGKTTSAKPVPQVVRSSSTMRIPKAAITGPASVRSVPKAGGQSLYSNTKPSTTAKAGKWGRGLVLGGLGAGGALGLLRGFSNPSEIDEESLGLVAEEGSPGMGEIGLGAAGGAAAGGLGSLLYGKLRDKPDLQRDVILALVGAAAGGAIPMLKSAGHEKEAITGAEIAILALLGLGTVGQGVGLYQANSQHKSNMKTLAQQQRALEAIERAKLQETAQNRKAMTYGTTGALLGGATGGTLSNIYGKKTGRESLRRDVMSALAGAGIGGAAGLYGATKV